MRASFAVQRAPLALPAIAWTPPCDEQPSDLTMLRAAILFLVLALVAGLLGFTGIAGTSTAIAKILFVVFLVLFLLGLLFGQRRRT